MSTILEAALAFTDNLDPAPDLTIAEQFWAILSPNDPRVRLRFVKSGGGAREYWADSMAAIWPKVVELQAAGFEAYYVLNIAPHSDGHGWHGCVEDVDITGIRALAADFDEGLPDWEWHVTPDLIVNSSVVNGVRKGQALWLVADCPVEGFTAAQERLIAHYTDIGVPADASIVNPSRILRLPGSLHQKDPSNPQLVTFIGTAAPTPRPLATLTQGLPDAPPRKTKANAAPEDRHEVPVATLMDVLPYIDPSVPGRSRWMGILSGIKNSDFTGDDSFDVEDVVVRWSAGEFWNGPKDAPRWLSDGTPANFIGGTEKHPIPGDVPAREAFLTSNGNATFGTLVFHAKENGWTAQPPRDGDITYGYIPKQEAKAGEPVDDGGPRVINTAEAYDNHRVMAKWVTYADDDGEDADDTLAELAPRWIEKHVVTYLEGPGGLGKSMIALQDAACLAAGHDILGEPVEQAGVLYLNYEEPDKEFARRRARIKRHFGIAKGGDFQALHLKNEPAAHLLRVTKDGTIWLTRFGREFHAKLAERRDRGLHTFVVFDGIMDAILFEGSTRVEDTIARQVIAMLDRWCETFDFTAYAILHPSRAAERQGGGSYAPAWSTKPRVIHTFARVTLDSKKATKDTPRSQCFTRRKIEKRSHGESGHHVDMWFRDGCFEPLPTHANGGGEDPVDVAVDLACRQAKAGRVKRDGTVGGLKLTAQHGIIINYRRRVGKTVGPTHFLASLAEAQTAGKINYHDATRNSRQPAGYYPVDGWEPIEEDGIPYAVDPASFTAA
jgi:hypothetical protein